MLSSVVGVGFSTSELSAVTVGKASVCAVSAFAEGVDFPELSLLPETEAAELSSGSVLWIISAETVFCEELSVVCGFSVFAQSEKERISAAKTEPPPVK